MRSWGWLCNKLFVCLIHFCYSHHNISSNRKEETEIFTFEMDLVAYTYHRNINVDFALGPPWKSLQANFHGRRYISLCTWINYFRTKIQHVEPHIIHCGMRKACQRSAFSSGDYIWSWNLKVSSGVRTILGLDHTNSTLEELKSGEFDFFSFSEMLASYLCQNIKGNNFTFIWESRCFIIESSDAGCVFLGFIHGDLTLMSQVTFISKDTHHWKFELKLFYIW